MIPKGIRSTMACLNSLATFCLKRDSMLHIHWPITNISTPLSQASTLFRHCFCGYQRTDHLEKFPPMFCGSNLPNALPLSVKRSSVSEAQNAILKRQIVRDMGNNTNFELKVDQDVVRFNIGEQRDERRPHRTGKKTVIQENMSRKEKLNELRFYRLKAKKKMNSPNPEVRIRYKLEKAKRKEVWLIEKLRKYDLPKALPETHDPEILTEEEKFYLKRTGEKKKNYVPVGRRGVFGGVVLNMHLHWKKHETVKVICKPCKPGQVVQYAEELVRLSKGIVIDIMPNNTILFYRGKNYIRPEIMSPPDTLSKAKALEKYRYGQSLEHTSQFIEKLENELEEYHNHLTRFKKDNNCNIGKEKSDT